MVAFCEGKPCFPPELGLRAVGVGGKEAEVCVSEGWGHRRGTAASFVGSLVG